MLSHFNRTTGYLALKIAKMPSADMKKRETHVCFNLLLVQVSYH